MKKLLNRIVSPTPAFFVKVQIGCTALVAGAGAIIANESLAPGWCQVAKYVMVASLAVAAMAQTAKK